MRTFKNIFNKAALLFLFATFSTFAFAQTSKQDIEKARVIATDSLIHSQNFSFIAQTAVPMGGRSLNLTPEYFVRITKETVTADLPYFGRAYVAPMNPTEGGIRLSTSSFEYTIKNRKRDGWDIVITPKDAKDLRLLTLTVSSKGYSTLQVLSNNRQAISFTGYIAAIAQNKSN